MVTPAWNPPGHLLASEYVAVQPPLEPVGGVLVGGVLVGGVLGGGVLVGGVLGGVVEPSGATARPVVVEIMPAHSPRLLRSAMICGIAATVLGKPSCIRMTWPFCRLPAADTMSAVLTPL